MEITTGRFNELLTNPIPVTRLNTRHNEKRKGPWFEDARRCFEDAGSTWKGENDSNQSKGIFGSKNTLARHIVKSFRDFL